jgi:hypothetical protein
MRRTLENCSFANKNERLGIGRPEQRKGMCLGYQRSDGDDEPVEICKECCLQEINAEVNQSHS